jgi:hypothetical protein
MRGGNGEEFVSVMEGLDHAALFKTYNIDAQFPDLAGTEKDKKDKKWRDRR